MYIEAIFILNYNMVTDKGNCWEMRMNVRTTENRNLDQSHRSIYKNMVCFCYAIKMSCLSLERKKVF